MNSMSLRSRCTLLPLVFLFCFGSSLVHEQAYAGVTPGNLQGIDLDRPSAVVGQNIQVIDVSAGATAQEMAKAQQAFRDGHIIRMRLTETEVSGAPQRLHELMDVPFIRAEASSTSTVNGIPQKNSPEMLRVLAVRRNKLGQVHRVQSFTSADDPNPQSSWVKHFDDWVEEEREKSLQVEDPAPPAVAWTSLILFDTIQQTSYYKNFQQLTVSVYRLIETDSAHDWYMVLTDPSRKPDWHDSCDGLVVCDFHTIESGVSIVTPGAVVDHGPTGTLQTDSVGFTIGGGIPAGPSAAFSETWSQPSMVTTDQSTGALGSWDELVAFRGYACIPVVGNVPVVSSGTFKSHQGVVFSAMEGTTTIPIPITFSTDFCSVTGDVSRNVIHDKSQLTLSLSTGPPSFSVIPAALTIPPGGTSVIRITATILDSTQNFQWNALPDAGKNFLDIPPGPFAGSRDVSVSVEPGTALGQETNLEVNSVPSFGAPSVESGPLIVHVTVGNPTPTSGVLLAGGIIGQKVLATAEIYDEKKKVVLPVGDMHSPRWRHTATVLLNGSILIVGSASSNQGDGSAEAIASAEIFDPGTSKFTAVGSMATARVGHTATLLGDGRVLITGGEGVTALLASAEIYNPATQMFSPTGSLKVARHSHGALAFDSGRRVLVFGGLAGDGADSPQRSSEVWESATNSFTTSGKMAYGVYEFPQPVSLPGDHDNFVIAGGEGYLRTFSKEQVVMFPGASFAAGKNLGSERVAHTLTALKDGTLLVTGGANAVFALASAELRDSSGWTLLPSQMTIGRAKHVASLLADGTVFVAGGHDSNVVTLTSSEIYNPTTKTFTAGPSISGREEMTGTYFQLKDVPTATTVTSNDNPSSFGAEVAFIATIRPSLATGTMTFFDGSKSLGMATLSSGQGVLRTTTLPGGAHAVTAVYSGDSTFAGSTSTVLKQVINPVTTTTGLTSTPNPSHVGGAVALTATVTNAGGRTVTGAVKFFDGAAMLGMAELNGSSAIFNTSALSVKTHSLTAVYQGTNNDATSTSPAVTQQVNAVLIPTTSAVASNTNPSSFEQAVALTGVVRPGSRNVQPTGNLLFYDARIFIGSKALSGGVATLTTSALSIGNHVITVIYDGDSICSGSTSPALTQVVGQMATSTSLTSGPNPSTFRQGVKFTVTVTSNNGTPTGTVSLKEGATVWGTATLAGGIANVTISTLSGGSHSIIAAYSGASAFAGSSSSPTLQAVNPASTTTTASSSLNPSLRGQPVTFTALISSGSAGIPTGTVGFKDGQNVLGTGPVNGGKAAFTAGALSVGAHPITAVYSGDGNFTGSASSVFTQNVSLPVSKTSVTSSDNPSQVGQLVTFTAKVTGSGRIPSGTVIFMDGTNALGSTALIRGTAAFSISTLSAGAHSITAVYGGDASFAGSMSPTLSQVVNGKFAALVVLASSLNPSKFGKSVVFTATVTSLGGGNTPSGSITLSEGAIIYGSARLVTGVGVVPLTSLPIGLHPITATYGGDETHTGATSNSVQQQVNSAQ